MENKNLSKNIFSQDVKNKATRSGYGEGLVKAGEENQNIVVVCADLTESTKSNFFAEKFPDRFVQVGVAEQNMAGIAAGMAESGKTVFCSSYAVFNPGRNWEQIRASVCYTNANVIIAGSHAGVSVGPDGATHQALEDIALTRVLPNMKVVSPVDFEEAIKATVALSQMEGPSYLRLGREKTPLITLPETSFEFGKAYSLWEGEYPQVAIISTGPISYEALLAAKELESVGITSTVVNVHTIKPLDEQTVIRSARTCGAVVTVEEHQISGGLGGAVSECLSKNFPVPIEFVGMNDSFGESGKSDELLTKYGMKSTDIIKAAKEVIRRKNL